MGSGASVASGVQDATPAQLKETFGALSAEDSFESSKYSSATVLWLLYL